MRFGPKFFELHAGCYGIIGIKGYFKRIFNPCMISQTMFIIELESLMKQKLSKLAPPVIASATVMLGRLESFSKRIGQD